jgi:hypothetical protein
MEPKLWKVKSPSSKSVEVHSQKGRENIKFSHRIYFVLCIFNTWAYAILCSFTPLNIKVYI